MSSAATTKVQSGEAGNRIIRRSDHAHQVAGDGSKKETENDHHSGSHNRAGDDFAST